MNFIEKIDKLLSISKNKISSIQELERVTGLGMNTIRKAYTENREMSKRSTWKLLEEMGINQEWWDTGKGEIFIEKGTDELNPDDKKQMAVYQEFSKERELYERIIKGLEERVAFLEAQLGRANHGQ